MAPNVVLVVLIYAFAFGCRVIAQDDPCNDLVQGPVVFSVQNVSLSGRHTRRGLAFQVGTPPQNLALAVSG
jgi:hypothetical protein